MIRPPNHCGLFKPGHNPHWIQVNRALGDEVNLPAPGRLLRIEANGIVVIEVGGRENTVWSHEAGRVGEAAALRDERVTYQPRWGLLWVKSDVGNYAFCVADPPNRHQECPDQPPGGDALELLDRAGGFTARAVTVPPGE